MPEPLYPKDYPALPSVELRGIEPLSNDLKCLYLHMVSDFVLWFVLWVSHFFNETNHIVNQLFFLL